LSASEVVERVHLVRARSNELEIRSAQFARQLIKVSNSQFDFHFLGHQQILRQGFTTELPRTLRTPLGFIRLTGASPPPMLDFGVVFAFSFRELHSRMMSLSDASLFQKGLDYIC
jgi:hypothetical protein